MNKTFTADGLLVKADLKRIIPLSDTTIWRLERRGRFPRRIALSAKRVAWSKAEVHHWLAERMRTSQPAGGAA